MDIDLDPKGPRTTLQVTDLSKDVTEIMLYNKFNDAAPVKTVKLFKNPTTGESFEHAYITFKNESDAKKVWETMNKQKLNDVPMIITWPDLDSFEGTEENSIYIDNLHKDIDKEALHDTFSEFGKVISCKIPLNEKGKSKGYGFIHFKEEKVAKYVIEKVNGKLMLDQKVSVNKYIPKKERLKRELGNTQNFTNLFVKNFGDSLDGKQLRDMFSEFGEIKSCKVMTNEDGKSKGFGFVDFADHSAAVTAVQELNDKVVSGKLLFVGPAKKKAERQSDSSIHRGLSLFVKNLNESIGDDFLRELFCPYGKIKSAKVMRSDNNISKGFGFVCFSSEEEAKRGIYEMNNRIIIDKPLFVSFAQTKEERSNMIAMQCQNYVQTNQFNQMYPQNDASSNIPAMAQTPINLTPQIQPLQDHWPYLDTQIFNDMPTVEAVHGSATTPNMIFGDTPTSVFPLSPSFATINASPSSMVQAARPVFQSIPFDEPNIETYPTDGIGLSFGLSHNTLNTLECPEDNIDIPIEEFNIETYPTSGIGLSFGLSHNMMNTLSSPEDTSQPPSRQRTTTTTKFSPTQRAITSQASSMQRIITPHSSDMQRVITSRPSASQDTITSRPSETQYITSPLPSTQKAKFMVTKSVIANVAPQEGKRMLGECLYPYVEKFHPELAGKITGMLLEFNNDYLLQLLEDEKLIKEKADEVVGIIKATHIREQMVASISSKVEGLKIDER